MAPIDFDDLGFMTYCTRNLIGCDGKPITVMVVPIIHPDALADLLAERDHDSELDDAGYYLQRMQVRVDDARESAWMCESSDQVYLAPIYNWDAFNTSGRQLDFDQSMEILDTWAEVCPDQILVKCDDQVFDALRCRKLQDLISETVAVWEEENQELDEDEITEKAGIFLETEIYPLLQDHNHLTYTIKLPTHEGPLFISGTIVIDGIDILSVEDLLLSIGDGSTADHALCAVTLLLMHSGGLILRTMNPEGQKHHDESISGWFIGEEQAIHMSSAEVFASQCTDPDGDPIPPEPGVSYLGPEENTVVDLSMWQ